MNGAVRFCSPAPYGIDGSRMVPAMAPREGERGRRVLLSEAKRTNSCGLVARRRGDANAAVSPETPVCEMVRFAFAHRHPMA